MQTLINFCIFAMFIMVIYDNYTLWKAIKNLLDAGNGHLRTTKYLMDASNRHEAVLISVTEQLKSDGK